jgi:hypothetical protein
MKPSKLPDFSGKVVYVALAGGERYNLTIASPHWEDHSGRLFLVGQVPPGGSSKDWCLGRVSGVAWDQITDYVVFDSLKDYHEHLGPFRRKKPKS